MCIMVKFRWKKDGGARGAKPQAISLPLFQPRDQHFRDFILGFGDDFLMRLWKIDLPFRKHQVPSSLLYCPCLCFLSKASPFLLALRRFLAFSCLGIRLLFNYLAGSLGLLAIVLKSSTSVLRWLTTMVRVSDRSEGRSSLAIRVEFMSQVGLSFQGSWFIRFLSVYILEILLQS